MTHPIITLDRCRGTVNISGGESGHTSTNPYRIFFSAICTTADVAGCLCRLGCKPWFPCEALWPLRRALLAIRAECAQ